MNKVDYPKGYKFPNGFVLTGRTERRKTALYREAVCPICGKIDFFSLTALQNSKSCGCRINVKTAKKGEIIGGLELMEDLQKVSRIKARFKCIHCGKVVYRSYSMVKFREYQSCGCISNKKGRKTKKEVAKSDVTTIEHLCKRFGLNFDKDKMTINGAEIYFKNNRWLLKTDDTDIVKAVYKKFGYHNPTVAENYRGIF